MNHRLLAKVKVLSLALATAVFFSGCNSTGGLVSQQPSSPANERPSAYTPTQAETQLQQALDATSKGDYLQARLLAESLSLGSFQRYEPQAQYMLLQSELALYDANDLRESLRWADHLEAQALQYLPLEDRPRFQMLRAEIMALDGDFLNSVTTRVQLAPQLQGDLAAANHESIWHTLTLIPNDLLQTYYNETSYPEVRSWLDLARVTKRSEFDLDQQIRLVESWFQSHPNHPASINPPGPLAQLRDFASSQPDAITLVLPLSGRFAATGQAVRDGFLAAYYEASEKSPTLPSIDVVDSMTIQDFSRFVAEKAKSGTELIVGPLQKSAVEQLSSSRSRLDIPVLALNYTDSTIESPNNLFQFGLSAEDEARQVADQAWLEGYRTVGALVPQSRWGDRVFTAFSEYWQSMGGQIAEAQFYKGQADYSEKVKSLLNVDASERRSKDMKNELGNVATRSRRRQDIDWILMLGNAKQARQLKPALAFHFGGDLPVYSTSTVFTGVIQAHKDKDLNGIKFCDMPWLHDTDNTLRTEIHQNWENASRGYDRLYALGVDAFRLSPRLTQLQTFPQTQIEGATGDLSLNNQRKISRKLVWLEMKRGKPEPYTVSIEALEDSLEKENVLQ